MKYVVNLNVVLFGTQDPAVLREEIEKELSEGNGKNQLQILLIINVVCFLIFYVYIFISGSVAVNLSGDSSITAKYRLTVETKGIQDATVIGKLTSSSLEGKDIKSLEDSDCEPTTGSRPDIGYLL